MRNARVFAQRICFRALAPVVVIFNLAGAPSFSSAGQSITYAPVRRVWTNDDFPARPAARPQAEDKAVPPAAARTEPAKVETGEAGTEPKPISWSPPEAATRDYEKMSAEDRNALVKDDQEEILRVKKKITELQLAMSSSAFEENHSALFQVKRLNRVVEGYDAEIKTLRTLQQRESPQKESVDSSPVTNVPTTTSQ